MGDKMKKKDKTEKEKITKNYLSTKNMLIFWCVVIVIGWIFGGNNLALGLFVAAIMSFALVYFSLNSSWEGTVEKIRSENVYDDPQADNHNFKVVDYAYVRLSNGRLKKMHLYPDWKVGDKLRKEKGKFGPEKI